MEWGGVGVLPRGFTAPALWSLAFDFLEVGCVLGQNTLVPRSRRRIEGKSPHGALRRFLFYLFLAFVTIPSMTIHAVLRKLVFLKRAAAVALD